MRNFDFRPIIVAITLLVLIGSLCRLIFGQDFSRFHANQLTPILCIAIPILLLAYVISVSATWLFWVRLRAKYDLLKEPISIQWLDLNWICEPSRMTLLSPIHICLASDSAGIYLARPFSSYPDNLLVCWLRKLFYKPIRIPWSSIKTVRWQKDHMLLELTDTTLQMSLSEKVFEDARKYKPHDQVIDVRRYDLPGAP
jgi:hypothetical protein